MRPVELEAHPRTPVSDIILATARDWPLPRIALGELIAAFGSRSCGLLIVLFAIPNLLPVYIPGLSPIFGVPLTIIALQLALGQPMPWLPGFPHPPVAAAGGSAEDRRGSAA